MNNDLLVCFSVLSCCGFALLALATDSDLIKDTLAVVGWIAVAVLIGMTHA